MRAISGRLITPICVITRGMRAKAIIFGGWTERSPARGWLGILAFAFSLYRRVALWRDRRGDLSAGILGATAGAGSEGRCLRCAR